MIVGVADLGTEPPCHSARRGGNRRQQLRKSVYSLTPESFLFLCRLREATMTSAEELVSTRTDNVQSPCRFVPRLLESTYCVL